MSTLRSLCVLRGLTALLTLATPAAANPERIETLEFVDADGHAIVLDAPGVLYLVDFWALDCKPCMAEMPELDRLAKEYEPGGRFRLVSVVWGGWKGRDLLKVAKQAGTTLPVHADSRDRLEQLSGKAFPTKLMIRDGMLLYRFRGGGPGAYDRLKPLIDEQLKGPPGGAKP